MAQTKVSLRKNDIYALGMQAALWPILKSVYERMVGMLYVAGIVAQPEVP